MLPSACAEFDETKRKSCDCTSNWFPHGKEQRRGQTAEAYCKRETCIWRYQYAVQCFANTGTNVSVVFFDNSKSSDKVILIDASKLGEEYQEGNNKKVRLTPSEIDMIVDTFLNKKTVEDFSVAVSYEDIEAKKCSLAAGQYFDVKIEYVELTQEEFESKMSELTSNLQSYFDEGNVLQKEIMEQLKRVKYEQI